MKKIVYTLVLLATFMSCTTEDSDPCATFDALDLEMLNLIEEIKAKHADNKKFLSKFSLEQVYWIQYRDAHLRALYPLDWDRYYRKNYGKEVFNPCKCKEMVRFTKERIKELNFWVKNGPAGQDECPSQWQNE